MKNQSDGFSDAITTSGTWVVCGQAIFLITKIVMHNDPNLQIVEIFIQLLWMLSGLTSLSNIQKTMKYWGEIYLGMYIAGMWFAWRLGWIEPVEVIVTFVIGGFMLMYRIRKRIGNAIKWVSDRIS
jgi:hypothetical protein